MYELRVKTVFSAAHHLIDYPGACQRIHGHNWTVCAALRANETDQSGMVIDLMEFNRLLNECIEQFDHRVINTVPPFDRINPTSENMAKYVYDWLAEHLPESVRMHHVSIAETDSFSVRYTAE
ncbi:6-carboxytetrahydropterin synthase QueD [candidate division KSB1 bacterium]|nr:6-carboxytetrahydropterin synthase QueD [candidate division KSB1 bacterium]